jgi:predicted transcriptional regulator
MMSENIAQNMQSSQGIINYLKQLHLDGHFRILYHDAGKCEYQVSNYRLGQILRQS